MYVHVQYMRINVYTYSRTFAWFFSERKKSQGVIDRSRSPDS